MNGKSYLFAIACTAASSGWWYCATQQASVAATPALLVPVLATLICAAMIFGEIFDNWED